MPSSSDPIQALNSQIAAMQGQIESLSEQVATLNSRLMTSSPSSSPDPTSGYSVLQSQFLARYARLNIDLRDFVFTDNGIPNGVTWTQGTLIYQGIAYPIAAGSGTTSTPFIYWQLASPYSFQTSATIPALGANDFVIGFINPGTVAGNGGYFELALDYHDNIGGRMLISASAINLWNSTNNTVFTLRRSAADPPGAGVFDLTDGNGHNNILMSGSNGNATFSGTVTAASFSGPTVIPNSLVGGLPAAGTLGRLYVVTDLVGGFAYGANITAGGGGGATALVIDTGSTWVKA